MKREPFCVMRPHFNRYNNKVEWAVDRYNGNFQWQGTSLHKTEDEAKKKLSDARAALREMVKFANAKKLVVNADISH